MGNSFADNFNDLIIDFDYKTRVYKLETLNHEMSNRLQIISISIILLSIMFLFIVVLS